MKKKELKTYRIGYVITGMRDIKARTEAEARKKFDLIDIDELALDEYGDMSIEYCEALTLNY
jgi:hypothetical protein